MKKVAVLVMLCLLCSAASPAVSAGPAAERGSKPIYIKSDRLEAETKGNQAEFLGNVSARQDDVILYADRMVVFYAEGGDVDRVECYGNVRIVQGSRTGLGGKGVYDSRRGIIVLTENPRLTQGDDTVTGREVVYDVATQRSKVIGTAESRVEAVIHPKAKEKNEPRP